MNLKTLTLWSVITLVALLVAAVIAIKLFVSPRAVAALVTPRLEQILQRKVRVGETELLIFGRVGARLHGLSIENAPPFEGRPLATIEYVDAELRLMPLLWGDLKLKRLRFSGWELYLLKDSSGISNFNFPCPDKARGKAPRRERIAPAFQSLAFDRGRLLYRNDSTGVRMALGNIDFESQLGGGERADVEASLHIDTLFVWTAWANYLASANAMEAELRGEYSAAADSLMISECSWRIDKIKGRLEGSAAMVSSSPDLRLRLLSEHTDLLDLYDSRIVSAFPVLKDVDLAGEMRIDVSYRGPIGGGKSSDVRGKVNITDARARFPASQNELRMKLVECNFSERSLSVFTEEGAIAEAPAMFRLAVDDYHDPTISGEIKFTCDAGYLGEIARLDKRKQLSGKVDVSLSGFIRPSDKEEARLFGSIVCEGISYSDPAEGFALDTLNAVCSFSGNDAELAQFDLSVGANRLQLLGKIRNFAPYVASRRKPHQRPQFDFVCSADSFNFDKLSSTETDSDDTTLVMQALDYLLDFDARGSLEIGNGRYSGVQFSGLKANVIVINRIISSDSVVCRVFGGSSASDVVVDATDLRAPEFEIDCAATGVQANDFLCRFTSFEDRVSGSLNLEASFKGSGLTEQYIAATLTAEGKAWMKEGEIVGLPLLDDFRRRFGFEAVPRGEFEDLLANFAVADRSISLFPLNFKSGKTNCQVRGSVDFRGVYDLRLDRSLNREEGRLLFDLPEARARFHVSSPAKALFHITGNADTSSMTIDSLAGKD